MIFQPRQKGQKYNLAFTIDGPPIEQVKGSVFLGVVIDEKLTWKPHMLNVSRKSWYPVQVKFLPFCNLSLYFVL